MQTELYCTLPIPQIDLRSYVPLMFGLKVSELGFGSYLNYYQTEGDGETVSDPAMDLVQDTSRRSHTVL